MSNNQFHGKIHYTWTQPYVSLNPVYQSNISKEEIKVKQEIKRWEYVDRIVDNMDSYPDAEKMIRNIFL